MQTSTPPKTKARKPGRPRANEPQGEELKEGIIDAASRVYGDVGYSAATVEMLSQAGGVSRALFYRLFKDKHEVIDLVVTKANDQLRTAMMAALIPGMDQINLVKTMIGLYFEWCEAQGQVAAAIYHEFHNPDSPAAMRRDQLVAEIAQIWRLIAQQQGEKPLKPFMIDTLVRAIEHAGSSAYCPSPKPPEQIAMYRAVAERVLLASIAKPGEYDRIPSLDGVVE